jgi:hypothetical protein
MNDMIENDMLSNDLSRWALCHLVAAGLPTAAVYFLAGDSPWSTGVVLITLALTASWGSWSSLQVTRDETLRALSRSMAGLWPAIVIPIVAAVFLMEHRSPAEIFILISTVIGTSTASFMMSRRLRSSEIEAPEIISALVIFPVMTTLIGWLLLMAGVELFDMVDGPIQRAIVSTLLLSIVTTIVPAGTAWGLESACDPFGG